MGTKPGRKKDSDLVLDAMRLAEFSHRTRKEGPHYRKAPKGEDRPAYFIHLAEVAWMLQEAGLNPETVAAGYLHDIIEDCGHTRRQLAREIGNDRVARLVQWVSEPDKKKSWELRNHAYHRRMKRASRSVLALSCADKTSNLRDMNRSLARGYRTEDFTKKDHATQMGKFGALDVLYRRQVPKKLYRRFSTALTEFRARADGNAQ